MKKTQTAQFPLFLVANSLAAATNISIKIASSFLVPDQLSVGAGFVAGLLTSYLLCRKYVFRVRSKIKPAEVAKFLSVNLIGLAVTYGTYKLVLSFLHNLLHANLSSTPIQALAYTAGVGAPMFFSFMAQKSFTFR